MGSPSGWLAAIGALSIGAKTIHWLKAQTNAPFVEAEIDRLSKMIAQNKATKDKLVEVRDQFERGAPATIQATDQFLEEIQEALNNCDDVVRSLVVLDTEKFSYLLEMFIRARTSAEVIAQEAEHYCSVRHYEYMILNFSAHKRFDENFTSCTAAMITILEKADAPLNQEYWRLTHWRHKYTIPKKNHSFTSSA